MLGYTVTGHPLDRFPDVDWRTYCPIFELHHYKNQRVTICGLIIKFISVCDRTGIVECEIFAAAYLAHGLATVRYPVVQVTGEVKPFANAAGFTLDVLRGAKGRAAH